MERLQGDDAVLEYETKGGGEPVLLIHASVTADGLAFPLLQRQELTSLYLLITYHRRGYGGTHAWDAASDHRTASSGRRPPPFASWGG